MSLMKKKKALLLCLSFFMIALLGILSMKVVNASGETKLETDGTCITGTVDDGAAYYYFETTENGTVRVGVNNSDLDLTVSKNSTYSNVVTLDSNGYADIKAGTYYVRVKGTGSYEISANFTKFTDNDAEPNDTKENAIALTSGEKVTGNAYTTYNDFDWYKFEITTKSYVYIELNNNKQSSLIYNEGGECYTYILNGVSIVTYDEPGTYYFSVSSGNPYGYYDLTATIVEYPTVSELTSAVYKGSRKVELTWNKSQYAEGYYLYYKTSATGKWNHIELDPEDTSYTHLYGPSEGQTYYYAIQAFKNSDHYGVIWNPDEPNIVTVTGTVILPTVENVKAQSVSGKAIKVSWNADGTAAGYKIYRKANGGAYKSVNTITSATTLNWTDTSVKKGTYYTYKVVPYITSNGTTSNGTGVVTSSVKLAGKIAKVTNVKVKKNTSYNTVSWKKNSLATGYQVYRKAGSGSYKLVKTTTSASYKDKSVSNGKKYTYKIKAYYKNYTYNANKGKYTSKNVTSIYSKIASVKR